MRYDKYEPKGGGFRAPLAAALATVDGLIGVGLDVNGRVVAGAGNTGIVAVLSVPEAKAAGDVVDNMTDGEVVEFNGVAGTVYYANPTNGVIGTDPDAGGAVGAGAAVRVGHTVEASRLIVRTER